MLRLAAAVALVLAPAASRDFPPDDAGVADAGVPMAEPLQQAADAGVLRAAPESAEVAAPSPEHCTAPVSLSDEAPR